MRFAALVKTYVMGVVGAAAILANVAAALPIGYRLSILVGDCHLQPYCDHMDGDEIRIVLLLAQLGCMLSGVALLPHFRTPRRWFPWLRFGWSAGQWALYAALVHFKYIVTYEEYLRYPGGGH